MDGWQYLTVVAVLNNPLYTGCAVYGRWQKVEELLDPDDVAAGYVVRFRRSPHAKIVRSREPAHPAIIFVNTFTEAQLRQRERKSDGMPEWSAVERRRTSKKRVYALRGQVRCGLCARKMEGAAQAAGRCLLAVQRANAGSGVRQCIGASSADLPARGRRDACRQSMDRIAVRSRASLRDDPQVPGKIATQLRSASRSLVRDRCSDLDSGGRRGRRAYAGELVHGLERGGQFGQLVAACCDRVLEGWPLVDAPVGVIGLAVVVVVDVGAPAAGVGVVDVQSEVHGPESVGVCGWDQKGSGRPDGVRRSSGCVFLRVNVRSGLRQIWICRFAPVVGSGATGRRSTSDYLVGMTSVIESSGVFGELLISVPR
jgi:hypothetical protein